MLVIHMKFLYIFSIVPLTKKRFDANKHTLCNNVMLNCLFVVHCLIWILQELKEPEVYVTILHYLR